MNSESLFSAQFTKTYAVVGGGDINLMSEGQGVWGPAGARKCRRIVVGGAGVLHVNYGLNEADPPVEVKDTITCAAGAVLDIMAWKILFDTSTITAFTVMW